MTKPGQNDHMWKSQVENNGLAHSGKSTSGPWKAEYRGTVTWTQAPPSTLVPGQPNPVGANLKVWQVKHKQNLATYAHVATHLWRQDGSYGGDPGGEPKTRGILNKPLEKSQASLSWSDTWTAPKGRKDVFLHVSYIGRPPGGACETIFIYRWDEAGVAVKPPEEVEPLKVSLSANKKAVLLGQKVTLRAKVSGGKKPYSFLWLGRHKNKTPAVNVTPKSRGDRNYSVQVTDAQGKTASAQVKVTVLESTEPLTISLSADRTKTRVGEKVNLKAQVKGGTKPYKITWQNGEGSGAAFAFEPTEPGQHRITAKVSDSKSLTAQAHMVIEAKDKVEAPRELKVRLQLSGPIEYGPKGSPVPMVRVNQLVTVRAKASGGSGKYKFEWSGDRGWRPDEDPNMVTYVSRLPGRPNLSVQVVDTKTGQRGSAQLELQVYGVVVNISGPARASMGPPSPGNPPAKFTVSLPKGGNGLNGSPLQGKPLYLLLQPHPEARWGCDNPQAENCEGVNNCMGFEVNNFRGSHSATAIFCESGTTAVWAEVYAVVGPQKILVGDAYMDVEVN